MATLKATFGKNWATFIPTFGHTRLPTASDLKDKTLTKLDRCHNVR